MQVLLGQTISFNADPAKIGSDAALNHEENGALVISDAGMILWHGSKSNLPPDYKDIPKTDFGDSIISAGFIDAHLHFPQYRMIAAYGRDLMEWLNKYTFIEEQRYSEKSFAENAAEKFLSELATNGITSCLAFSTIHPEALDSIFAAAEQKEIALISGKTLMDENAPKSLCDTAQTGFDQSVELIEKWHSKGRLKYAISPRFAVTSSDAQLEATGALAKKYPALHIQTHLSENYTEIEIVAKKFPSAKDYTDVYDQYGLLGPNSVFAHGIHLSERELTRLSECGSSIVHCPTSNNFLGSGHLKLHDYSNRNSAVNIGIGCDIGGGTSFSMLQTMRDAYVVSQHVGSRISAFEAFYMGTLGNAKILNLDHEVGNLDDGKYADLVVLNPKATPIMAERHTLSNSIHDILFALMIMGDDRAIEQTYVKGKPIKIA